MRVGFVGLGNLGRHLATSIVRAGFPLCVHDRDPVAVEPLVAAGARAAGSAREVAATSDCVVTCLPSPRAVADVVAGADGVLAGLRPGGAWIETSTGDVHELERLAALAARRGIRVLECPVTGGVHRAAAGEITVLAGGDAAVLAEHLPVLEAFGGRIVLAAGVWSQALLAAAGVDVPIGAERLQVLATARLEQQIEPCVYGPLAAKQYALFRDLPSYDDAHFREDYEDEAGIEMLEAVAQRRNGEILLGLPMDYPAELDARPTLEGLAAIVRAVATDLPGLRTAPIDRAWAGLLPYTPDTLPVIDRALPGLVVAAGHVFGNAAGPMTGRLIADVVRGREPSLSLAECRLARGLELAPPGIATRW